ncbi:hypothetical protein QOZ80_6AG0526250 [Eleusine coracana subsp. coracana]|nr:hypothetical protein QOZ80_6AG0526250 [Eleusine coracana subsp. coracana]
MPPLKKKKKQPAPPVASTGCSSLIKSWSCLRRRGSPQPRVEDGDANVEQCLQLKRVQSLEEEIRRLTNLLGQEERTAAEHVTRGGRAEGGGVGNVTVAKAKEEGRASRNSARSKEEEERTSTGTDTTSSTCTKRCVSVGVVGHGAGGVERITMVKLEDGSFLREVISRRAVLPWERLAVQVSQPIIPVDAATASEVIDKMTAMRPDDLCKFLANMMPLKDIAGRQTPGGEPVRRPARLSSGKDLVEALVLKAMDRMEGLVMEGLMMIQMANTSSDSTGFNAMCRNAETERRFNFLKKWDSAVTGDRQQRHKPVDKDCIVCVILIQVRDPKQRYDAIGELMIGIIEASLEKIDDKVKVKIQGIHVAGIGFANRKSSCVRDSRVQ